MTPKIPAVALPICGCGTNHEAFEAALKLARSAFKVAPDVEDHYCPNWMLAVTESLAHITFQYALARAHRQVEDHPEEYTGITREDVRNSLAAKIEQAVKYQLAATFANTRLTKDVAKFICEELNAGDGERGAIENGVSMRTMQEMGFHVEEANIPSELAQILGVDFSAFEDDITSGSKPH